MPLNKWHSGILVLAIGVTAIGTATLALRQFHPRAAESKMPVHSIGESQDGMMFGTSESGPALATVPNGNNELGRFDSTCKSIGLPPGQTQRLRSIAEAVLVSSRIVERIQDASLRSEAEARLEKQVDLVTAGIIDSAHREPIKQAMLGRAERVEQ